jgi:hypothetical protein
MTGFDAQADRQAPIENELKAEQAAADDVDLWVFRCGRRPRQWSGRSTSCSTRC